MRGHRHRPEKLGEASTQRLGVEDPFQALLDAIEHLSLPLNMLGREFRAARSPLFQDGMGLGPAKASTDRHPAEANGR